MRAPRAFCTSFGVLHSHVVIVFRLFDVLTSTNEHFLMQFLRRPSLACGFCSFKRALDEHWRALTSTLLMKDLLRFFLKKTFYLRLFRLFFRRLKNTSKFLEISWNSTQKISNNFWKNFLKIFWKIKKKRKFLKNFQKS